MTMTGEHARRAIGIALALLVAASAASAAGGDPANLRQLFPRRASLQAERSGLCRLEPPPELLATCRPDMADLRIFDADGSELPFVVDNVDRGSEPLTVIATVRGQVVGVTRNELRSEHGPTRFVESFTVAMPPLPEGAAAWDLVVEPGRSSFVARLDVSAVGVDGSTEVVFDGGSVFRIAEPKAERIRFPLTLQASSTSRLVVRLTSHEGSYLNPSLSFAAQRFLPAREDAEVWLETSSLYSTANSTVMVLHRPRGLIPSRLRLATTTGSFNREVTVWDAGPGSVDAPLAAATLFRLDAIAAVEQLEIQLHTARGDRLRLQIDDRDSPPLKDLRIAALIHRPVIYFSLPDGQREATVYFGGARAHRPQYDLASFLPAPALPISGAAAERALPFLDPAQAGRVQMSPSEVNPAYDAQPALAFAMRAGAPLDNGSTYSSRRTLEVEPSVEGLSRLRLDAADLAELRPDLADLRVVDAEGRQWAYLVEQGADQADLELDVERLTDDKHSIYALSLPHDSITAHRIELEIAEPFFDRPFELNAVTDERQDLPLTNGRLTRRQGDPRAVSLSFPTTRLRELRLTIVDGDDAPLNIDRVRARIPRPDVYLTAPAGSYAMLLGNPQARPPSYELERVRSTVLAVPASLITAGPLEANPGYSAGSRLFSSAGAQQTALWVVLGLAVVILAVFSFRLAKS